MTAGIYKERMKKMAKIKMDCIHLDGMRTDKKCRALKKLYCSKKEACSFYKSRSEYNMDGSRKGKE
jgi:hypothetical protein